MFVRFHPAARSELLEARSWYEERSLASATAFAQEIASAIGRIAETPGRYPISDHNTRRVILRRFPFSIFFRKGIEEIVIVAIAHQKRRPGYWRRR